MASQILTEQLRTLLRCGLCKIEKTNLKQLPCQHTVCEQCLADIVCEETNKFECPNPDCPKECLVPNGGMSGFPDSLIAKQMADILKSTPTADAAANGIESATPEVSTIKPESVSKKKPSEDEKVKELLNNSSKRVQLRKELEKLAANTHSWIGHTRKKMDVVSTDLSGLPSSCQMAKKELQTSRDKLKAEYQKKMKELDEKTKEKIDDIQKHRSDREEEIESWLREIEPKLCQVQDAMRDAEVILKGISNKNANVARVEKALEKVNLLKACNLPMGKHPEWSQFIVTDSCRLDVSPEDVAQNLLTSSRANFSQIGRLAKHEKLPTGTIMVEVIIPGVGENLCSTWTGDLNRISKSLKPSPIPLPYSRVRFSKPPSAKPKYPISDDLIELQRRLYGSKTEGWIRKLRLHADAGKLVNIVIAMVRFPDGLCWTGLIDDLDLVEGPVIKPGDKVWIARYINRPSQGFNGVTRSSCGVVMSINGQTGDNDIVVNFPECTSWRGKAEEVEGAVTPFEDFKVQVSLHTSLTDVKKWKGVSHEDVGVVEKIRDGFNHKGEKTKLATVRFNDKTVDCELGEIEEAMAANVAQNEEKQSPRDDEGRLEPGFFDQVLSNMALNESLRRFMGE